MRGLLISIIVFSLAGCISTRYSGETLSELDPVDINSQRQQVFVSSLDETIDAYRALLDFPTDNPFRPQAMHRLADLLLDYGEEQEVKLADKNEIAEIEAYTEAINIYEDLLSTYPDYPATDQVLYQLARAYDKKADIDKTVYLLSNLVLEYPDSQHISEAQFRLGELNFLFGNYTEAAQAYQAVVDLGPTNAFYEHSLLKYSWALFKQEQLDPALVSFFSLIELKLDQIVFNQIDGAPINLGKADEEIVNDTLRGITLIFALKDNEQELDQYAEAHGHPEYNHLVYQRIAELYHGDERYHEEARIYSFYIAAYPESIHTPIFQLRLVDSYRFAKDHNQVNQAKADFLTRDWQPDANQQAISVEYQAHLNMFAKQYLHDLSEYYHSRYQKGKIDADFESAVHWYQLYLANFHAEPDAIEKHFLLAELLFENNDFEASGYEYEQVAYFYPLHDRAAEAGYSAILSYQKLLENSDQESVETWRQLLHKAALQFIASFPQDSRVPNTVLTLANEDFELGDVDNAKLMVDLLLNSKQKLDDVTAYSSWMLLGHIAHQEQDYLRAEQAFQSARKFVASNTKQALEAEEWQALSIYKQADVLLAQGEKQEAVVLLLRIPETAPSSKAAAQAKYDAAAELIGLGEWQQAAKLLEQFQTTYPSHNLQPEVPTKLAFVYMKLGKTAEAANAYEQIASRNQDPEVQQEALLQAAQLYYESDNHTKAVLAYKRYLQIYPDPTGQSFYVRSQLVMIYASLGQTSNRDYWLKDIIKSADAPELKQDDSIQYQAAKASFTLAEDRYAEFEAVELVEPIRQNLAQKKQKMENALDAYQQASKYGYAEFVTASTYRIGEIYFHLSQALFESERPRNLDEEELEQYEIMLEEQAYPFEEKAIEILETNVTRIDDGIYNNWVDQSFAALAELLPVQYAKKEVPSEVINDLH